MYKKINIKNILYILFLFGICNANNSAITKLNKVASVDKGDKQVIQTKKRKIRDKILARVNGVNILHSDLQKPQIVKSGQLFDLEEAINYELLFQKAAEKKMLPKKVEVEKQIVSLKVHNNLAHLTDEEFKEELKKEGFSIDEYEEQLGKMLAVEKIKHAELSERVMVTNQDVENYFNQNPEWEAEKYLLKIAQVSESLIDSRGNIKNKNLNLKWDDLGWIEKKDLSSKLIFVSEMEKGQISKPFKMNDSYQLVKLEDKKQKRLRTLEERYSEILITLQMLKREKFEKELAEDLRANASIVYLS